MTSLAADLDIVLIGNKEPAVGGIEHVPPDVLMTEHAVLVTDKLPTLCLRDHKHGPVDRLAGNQADQDSTHGDPQTRAH